MRRVDVVKTSWKIVIALGVLACSLIVGDFILMRVLSTEPATLEQHKRNVANCNSIGGQVVIWEDQDFARCYVNGEQVFNWLKPDEPVFEDGDTA